MTEARALLPGCPAGEATNSESCACIIESEALLLMFSCIYKAFSRAQVAALKPHCGTLAWKGQEEDKFKCSDLDKTHVLFRGSKTNHDGACQCHSVSR